jgi:hypothetical protein
VDSLPSRIVLKKREAVLYLVEWSYYGRPYVFCGEVSSIIQHKCTTFMLNETAFRVDQTAVRLLINHGYNPTFVYGGVTYGFKFNKKEKRYKPYLIK